MYDSRSDRVCMSRRQLDMLLMNNRARPTCSIRDENVLSNPLYPPLNRTRCSDHLAMANAIQNRRMYVTTNGMNDQYRLIGYLTNNSTSSGVDSGNNLWKLFGNESSRHTHRFYMVPVDKNHDIKIAITDDILAPSQKKLRNMYDLPESVTFRTPLLKSTPYQLTEIPRADLTLDSGYM